MGREPIVSRARGCGGPALIFSLLVAMAGPCIHAAADQDALPQSAVVSLFRYDRSGALSTRGSGFFVSPDGLIATARHVVQDASKITGQTSSGERFTVEGVVGEDPVHDLVIVRISGDGYPSLPLGCFEDIQTDAGMRVICDPYGLQGKIIPGTVERIENVADEYQWFAVNAPTTPGESGSPVLNDGGQVAGLLIAEFENHEKGLVISVNAIRQLMVSATSADPEPVSNMNSRKYYELYQDANFEPALQAAFIGQNQEAARRMSLVCRDFPMSPAAFALLGTYYSQLNQWKAADQAFATATGIKPDYAFAMASLGLVRLYEGKQEAEGITNKAWLLAAAQKSRSADTWFNVGAALIVSKRFNEARSVVKYLRELRTLDADRRAKQLSDGMIGK